MPKEKASFAGFEYFSIGLITNFDKGVAEGKLMPYNVSMALVVAV